MEDKLVTLAILTYTKAQILKNVLENEGIETYIHNVNQIQPVVSSGVRLRIKESDLPRKNRKCRSHPVACLFHAYLCIVVALWGCFQLPDWR